MKQEIPQGFHFRASDHSYFYDGKRMTGITTILGVINKPALVGWAARMAVEYLADHIGELIGADKETTERILTDAKNAHTKKKEKAGEAGTDLHALAEGWIKMCIQETDGVPSLPCPAGLEKLRDWAQSENVKFLESEKKMYSKTWWVAGTVDMIFEKEGKKYIGDIKTQAKIWDRTPFFQMAGYANLYEEMMIEQAIPPTKGKMDYIDGYCILRVSKDGSFEAKWSFDVAGDTKAFFACVELFRQLQTFKTN